MELADITSAGIFERSSASRTARAFMTVASMALWSPVTRSIPAADNAAPLVAFHHTVRSAGGVGCTTEEVAQIAAGILPHSLSLVAALVPVELAAIDWQVVQPQVG